MKRVLLFVLNAFILQQSSQAQFSRYLVQFSDKPAGGFSLANPAAYLSQRAIDRRARYAIPVDSADLPVTAEYISQLSNIPGVTVLNSSRWLNAVTVLINGEQALNSINDLPFVKNTNGIAGKKNKQPETYDIEAPVQSRVKHKTALDYFDYGANSFKEIHLHQGEFLHNIGLHGEGMQIAMLDGGFFHYTNLSAFDSVNSNGQVLSTWDFVAGETSVVEDDAHGMMCFSTIAANIPGRFIGKAPKANFHLFRTEDVDAEYPIEEFNWVCGAEKADSAGADIISSSLGYGYDFNNPVPDYPYSDFNGDITISARGADMAAKKGLLIFNAAGNSGDDYWHYITSPADADSIIAVAAVSYAGLVGSFSSYGPAADGRVKPDLASIGVAAMVQGSNNAIGTASGTSFACPNLAGLGTCLWQGFPEFNNMQIIKALKEAGSIYASPDNRLGYGIPDMKKAFSALLVDYAGSSVSLSGCTVNISWTSKDIAAMKYEIERKTGTNYVKIAELSPAAGSTLASHSYQLTSSISGLEPGTVSYRIRQIIDTSAAGFTAVYIDSAAINIDIPCTSAGKNIRVVSNPTASGHDATLIVETDNAISNLSVHLYNMKGDLLLQFKRSKTAGLLAMNLPVSPFPAGKYIIKIYDDKKPIAQLGLLKL